MPGINRSCSIERALPNYLGIRIATCAEVLIMSTQTPELLGRVSIGYLYEGKCSNDFEEPKITLTLVGPYSILTKCPTRLGTICLETDLYYAASPEKTTGVDLLIHKPGVG